MFTFFSPNIWVFRNLKTSCSSNLVDTKCHLQIAHESSSGHEFQIQSLRQLRFIERWFKIFSFLYSVIQYKSPDVLGEIRRSGLLYFVLNS